MLHENCIVVTPFGSSSKKMRANFFNTKFQDYPLKIQDCFCAACWPWSARKHITECKQVSDFQNGIFKLRTHPNKKL